MSEATTNDARPGVTARDLERFAGKVDRHTDPDGCWPWTGALNREGRGRFTAGGVTLYSYVWALVYEGVEVAPGQPIRHICGNPTCVRPTHLDAEGGQRENNLDTLDHGQHRSARLDAQKVRRIRERWAAPDRPSQKEIAQEYGVTQSAISEVVTGKSWPRAGGPVRPSRRSQKPPPRYVSPVDSYLSTAYTTGRARDVRQEVGLSHRRCLSS